MAIIIDKDDSPKFYMFVRDIYGNTLGATRSDFTELKYSIYKYVSGVRTAVDGFTNINISSDNYYTQPQQYPSTIKGLSNEEIESGYNLTFFPYKITQDNGVDVWSSPFSETNALYEIVVTMAYQMTDPALTGTALLKRNFTISVQTRS